MVSDFDAIYQEYGKTVYCFLLSLSRDETLSEELTQETMFRAIMNISSFRGDSKISVWLCQIAKNLYLEWMKKNKRIVPIDESIDLYDSGRDIAAELADKDIADRILQHLHELEEPYKEVFTLAGLLFAMRPLTQLASCIQSGSGKSPLNICPKKSSCRLLPPMNTLHSRRQARNTRSQSAVRLSC